MCQGSEELSQRTRTRQGSDIAFWTVGYREISSIPWHSPIAAVSFTWQDPEPGRGLEAKGRLVAGLQLFCTLPRNRALPIEFSLLALGT